MCLLFFKVMIYRHGLTFHECGILQILHPLLVHGQVFCIFTPQLPYLPPKGVLGNYVG